MNKNQILKIYGTQYKANTIKLLTEAELASLIPSADSHIAIKPNLVSASAASFGATTHPEIIAGIIEYLHLHHYYNLTIMEGSWVGDSTADAYDVCGYRELSETYGVPLIDLQKENSFKKNCSGMELQICRPVNEIDFLINVPVLKGHCQTRITCALKNLKGLIPNAEKRRFHSLGLHKPIAHLASAVRQDFIVVDHICGDLDFEDGGNPVVRNGILAARDPVLVDSLVCSMLHYETKDVPYILLAEKLGVGCSDLTKADIQTMNPQADENIGIVRDPGQITGQEKETRTADQNPDPEEMPLPKKVVLVEDAVEEVESCSACYGYLIPALSRLHEEGLFHLLDEKICIGQGFRGKCGKLGVGNCTGKFDVSVAGCPPTEGQIYEALKQYIRRNKHV